MNFVLKLQLRLEDKKTRKHFRFPPWNGSAGGATLADVKSIVQRKCEKERTYTSTKRT